jgi:drug/metabolite transporter (DMT)-like permease
MSSRFSHPYLLLTLTTLFWSGNMVIGRAIRGDIPPMTLAFWRWTIALLLVLPLALPHLRAQWPQLRQGWKPILILGVLGVGGYNTLAYVALQYTAATNAVLLNSFIPIATIALSWLFLKKHLHRIEAIGVVLSFFGVATIVMRGDLSTLHSLTLNIGDLWMLGAVLVWAIYTIGLQWRPASGRHLNLHWGSFAALLYVGIFPSFLGYIFYNRAVGEVGASKASLFIHLMPVFGTVLSAIFLDEIPVWYHYTGIVFIFAGIWLTTAALPKLKPR